MDELTTLYRGGPIQHESPLLGFLPINGKQRYVFRVKKEANWHYPRLDQATPVSPPILTFII